MTSKKAKETPSKPGQQDEEELKSSDNLSIPLINYNSLKSKDNKIPSNSTELNKGFKEKRQTIEELKQDSCNEKIKPYNIHMDTSFILRVFMVDMFKLILRASNDIKRFKVLTTEHLPYLLPQHSIPLNYNRFLTNMNEKIDYASTLNRQINASDMLKVFLKTFKKELTVSILFNSVGYLSIFGYSLLIDWLISHIQVNGVDFQAYYIAAVLNIVVILSVLCGHNILRINVMVVSQFRNIFMKVLYSKVSSLSSFSVKEANVGKLVNLISNDLSSLEQRSHVMFALLSIPLPLIAVTAFLYIKYGLIGLLGLGIMMALCPIQLFFSKLNAQQFFEKTKYTDDRINLTNEIVEGIRLIKMYAWEDAFVHSINLFRKMELKKILISTIIMVLDQGIGNSFALFGTFIILYVQYHHSDSFVLDTALLFTTLNMLNFLKAQVVQVIGFGMSGILSLKIILERMISVVVLKETSMTQIERYVNNNKIGQSAEEQIGQIETGSILIKDFTAYWKENSPVLQNINLNITRGECICIVGKVGSGKSSFLNCILKEVPLYKGYFNFSGKLAYVEQEPYIFSSTVKENILFGCEYNEEFYKKVISACCLEQDIKSFQCGDETEIGERGINMSGGQKARISLARAIYSQADIYLFDDPLSAVDSKVAKVLFFDAIKTLCKNSTVLLVTHQVHFAKHTDRILIFDNGRITQQGTFKQLEKPLALLSSDLHVDLNTQKTNQESEFISENMEDVKNPEENSAKKENDTEEANDGKNGGANEIFTKEEDSVVNLKTYIEFFKTSGLLYLMPIIVVLYASSDIVFVFFNRELGSYDTTEDKTDMINMTGFLVLMFVAIQIIKHTSLCFAIKRASKILMDKMIVSLVRSKVLYFDTTPTGRILNRFSTDIGIIDEGLSMILIDIFEILIGVTVLFITIMIITPYFMIVTAFEFLILLVFLKYCKEGLIQTKQIDLKTRSPLMSYFSLTIQGVLPIRVYGQKENFEKTFDSLASDSLRAAFYFWISQRGFGAFIHLFATVCNSIGIFLLLSVTSSPSQIGQSIIYFMAGTEVLQWGIRQIVQLDVAMTSAQRCLNQIKVESEPPLITKYDQQVFNISKNTNQLENKGAKFSLKGELVFQNVNMRYRKGLDLVLKNLSFKIQPGKRVGFIGRTGAGKSSIIQALFRMTELEYESKNLGHFSDEENKRLNCDITLDGHSIKNLGLHTLRSAISIIPQVPFIFSGNIRRNLDPLDQYTDEEINRALKDIELYDKVYSLEKKLYEDMSNASDIFSTGQKQLICLGRAILRKSQLIVLDEATANVDMLTDELIQSKIRQRFSDSTVITIAHRLNTIADYDQVIVMDQGQVVEQGSPYQLLLNEKGSFYQMVQHTGTKNADLIFQIAKQKSKNGR